MKNEIRKIKKVIEAARLSETEAAEILFAEDGRFTGHIWEYACHYSKEDRERNGDLIFDELSPEVRYVVLTRFQSACLELNEKRLPFGRGKAHYSEFVASDYLN